MNIALVSREWGVARRSRIACDTDALARGLLDAGQNVRIITQATKQSLGFEPQARLIIHRLALPSELVSWPRVVLNFAVEAARLVVDLHGRDMLDVAEFPDLEASAAAMMLIASARWRPPVVAVRYGGAGDSGALAAAEQLSLLGADAVCEPAPPVAERIALYESLVTTRRTAVRSAGDRLNAWRDIGRAGRRERSKAPEQQP